MTDKYKACETCTAAGGLKALRALAGKAAYIINVHAESLKDTSTIKGEWPEGEEATRAEYVQMKNLSHKLSNA